MRVLKNIINISWDHFLMLLCIIDFIFSSIKVFFFFLLLLFTIQYGFQNTVIFLIIDTFQPNRYNYMRFLVHYFYQRKKFVHTYLLKI